MLTRGAAVALLSALVLFGCEHLPQVEDKVRERPAETAPIAATPAEVLLRSELDWFHQADLDARLARYESMQRTGRFDRCGQESLVMALVQSGRDPVPVEDRPDLIRAMEHCLDDERRAVPGGMAATLLNQLQVRESERQRRAELRQELNALQQREETTSRQLQELREIERSLRERGNSND
ncbi:hypothetical protein M0534_07555 [Methylonatrum kenyense]|uniref:hypothetical protein n=1 Tax=Methylonatrum kenyense TaxID=455253 RepID=UPI0020C15F3D|nr:hypothetical protein [Methylonatrum kenyense]MCK8516179.1 hypothetical protein [Methylonatrum kenyense]